MAMLLFSSCTPRTEEEKANKEQERQARIFNEIQEQLPDGATDVKDIGNGWCTFSLENRQFMFRFQHYRGGSKGYESSAIVELSPK